jgi:Fuc2NAc and GlcNAc transferase
VAAVAAVVTALVTPPVRRLALRRGLIDQPNERSSHLAPVPRGGGVAILAGATAGILVAAGLLGAGVLGGRPGLALGLGALLVAGAGLVDDARGLSPVVRLGVHVVAATLLWTAAGGLGRLPLPPPLDLALAPLPGGVLAVLWIVATINFFNFLDGIDGLASLQGVVTGAGIAVAGLSPATTVLGLALAGASLGFLPQNWSPARLFLGDVGSGLLGFCFAAVPFLLPEPQRSRALMLVGLSLFLFLADASLTLLRRALRGARLFEPHREHAYQRLVIGGMSHARVAGLVGAGSALATAAALLTVGRGEAAWLAMAVALLLFAGELALARAAARARA